jgi:hypothetical protein
MGPEVNAGVGFGICACVVVFGNVDAVGTRAPDAALNIALPAAG